MPDDAGTPGTEMHRALRIPEVVHEVVSHLTPAYAANADLAVLARTCTTFHDIALDALWEHQNTMMNLIQCMPADLWEIVAISPYPNPGVKAKSLSATRDIIPSDWTRLLTYSHRVKSLHHSAFCNYPSRQADLLDVFAVFRRNLSGDVLLPNLQSLIWRDSRETSFPFISLFLGRRLVSFDIVRCKSNSFGHYSILPTLALACPALKQVTIPGGWQEAQPGPPGTLCNFVRALTHVKSLQVARLDSPALVHLGRLSTLETLNADLSGAAAFPNIFLCSLFHNLLTTRLTAARINELTGFIRGWDMPQLKEFVATVRVSSMTDPIEDLYCELASRCSLQSLQTFKLVVNVDGLIHPTHAFEPLLSFPNLTAVFIQACTFDLDDTIISDMARAWPLIEELELDEADPEHLPRATLLCLRALADQCPQLNKLRITIDARDIPPFVPRQGPLMFHYELVMFNVGLSRISSAFGVARFISSLFDNLQAVGHEHTLHEDVPEIQNGFPLWEQVNEILPCLHGVRVEEWDWGAGFQKETLEEGKSA